MGLRFSPRVFVLVHGVLGLVACEQQTHFQSEGEKRRPEMRLLFAGYGSRVFVLETPGDVYMT